jgi:predicted  nucleic acid-binding Zn-ribbon protein
MSNESERNTVVVHENNGMPGWATFAIIALAIVAVGGLGVGIWATTHSQATRQSLTTDMQVMKQDNDKALDATNVRLAQVQNQNTTLQDDLDTITKRLRITQGELKKSRADAEQARLDQANQLTAMNDQMTTQLQTKANTSDVTAVSGQVTGVRTDLDTTKTDLESTKQNLQMARSELGTLIAKNHTEIDELRRLGERDYVEFTVEGKGKSQKVGNVVVELRGTNPGKNQYDLAVTIDDKRTERRNRATNEPIFFYTHGTHQPMEIVINSVEKNKVVGYLSIPKANQPAGEATGATSNR